MGMAMTNAHTDTQPGTQSGTQPGSVTGSSPVARSWFAQMRSVFGKPHVTLMSEAHDAAPEVDVATAAVSSLLATIPTLRFATPARLRALAEATTREHVEMGEAVLRQGHHADDVFYIVDGTFEVLISHFGHTPDFIRMLRTGDSFGELGVLYDVPRTATVRCASPGELLRIPGEAFLDTLETGT
jgi:cyclic nucleotide-binding protein